MKNETKEKHGYYTEIITLGNKMYALKNNDLKKKKLRTVIKMKGINSGQTYDNKHIDKKNKTISYTSINKYDGKKHLKYIDYKYIAKDYTLICDNMNFITGSRELFINGESLRKHNNVKHIKQLYDKGNLDKKNNITPLCI